MAAMLAKCPGSYDFQDFQGKEGQAKRWGGGGGEGGPDVQLVVFVF